MSENFRQRSKYSHPNQQDREAGFTLLEVLVVLVLIGLLATIAGPPLLRQLSKAKTDIAKAQIDSLSMNLDLYLLDLGKFPSTEDGLAALLTSPSGANGWLGPYVRKKSSLLDPWGRQFEYTATASASGYNLQTLGADGATGGEGEDRDIAFSK